MSGVEEYLAALPADRRAKLEAMRSTIRTAAPAADESIAYQMPAVRSHGRFLVSDGSWKRHISLFPASAAVVDALGADLTPYLAGKGTIRFEADRPIPLALIARVVEVRLTEVATASEL